MPCITADGHKLHPYIILNMKLVPQNKNFPKNVNCIVQENGLPKLWKIMANVVLNKRAEAL